MTGVHRTQTHDTMATTLPKVDTPLDLLSTLAEQRIELATTAAPAVPVTVKIVSPEPTLAGEAHFNADAGSSGVKVAHAVSMDAPKGASSIGLAAWSAAVREVSNLPQGRVASELSSTPSSPLSASPEELRRSTPASPLQPMRDARVDTEGRVHEGTPVGSPVGLRMNLEGTVRGGRPKFSAFSRSACASTEQRLSSSWSPAAFAATELRYPPTGGPEAPHTVPWSQNPRRKEGHCSEQTGGVAPDILAHSLPDLSSHWFSPGLRMGSPKIPARPSLPPPLSPGGTSPLPARAIRKNRSNAARRGQGTSGWDEYESDEVPDEYHRLMVQPPPCKPGVSPKWGAFPLFAQMRG